MIVTEAEAKTKWCPFSSIETETASAVNRDCPEDQTRCLASGCMAWAWDGAPWEFSNALEKPAAEGWVENITAHNHRAGWKRPTGELRTGYCGMMRKGARG